MAVKTPSYWKEEIFQPLVVVTTMFGNKVKIPNAYQKSWEFLMDLLETTKESKQEFLDGLVHTAKNKSQEDGDLIRVFLEDYQG